MKPTSKKIPTFDQLMIPLVRALQELGGSGTIEEINQKVFELAKFPDEILDIPHGEDGSRSEVEYRLAWSRTYLKKVGILENSARAVWSLTPEGKSAKDINPSEVLKKVREDFGSKGRKKKSEDKEPEEIEEIEKPEEIQDWKEKLRRVLFSMEASGFERLSQRILRESGFTQVEVTGRSGDGGIDGKGIARINGFLSFHVLFQCKKYQGSVSPSHIRDFRGAMQGRADKGLFITTGTFTRDAIKESTRDGAPPIDLIDGDQLVEKLKELKLGIQTKLVESVEVDEAWFKTI
jgi:restriction system protein